MAGPFTREKIENWVSDFCLSDAARSFSPQLRDVADAVLVGFLTAASEVRGVEPEDLEETDVKASLLGPVARLVLPAGVAGDVPAACGALLAYLQAQGRMGGGRVLGAYTKALTSSYLEAVSGKVKPIVRAGSKIGRNDPCPCGSGKKYKKCCLRE